MDMLSNFNVNRKANVNGLFTLNVCVCRELVQTHSLHVHLRHHYHTVKVDANVDVDANADVKCKQTIRVNGALRKSPVRHDVSLNNCRREPRDGTNIIYCGHSN